MSYSKLAERPLWLITRHEVSSPEVLAIGFEDDEQVLPVFSFEEEAQLFLRFHEVESGWKVRRPHPVSWSPCCADLAQT